MIRFAHASRGDLPALVELWNICFGPEFPMTERLLAQTTEHDPWYEPQATWIAHNGERIIAWVLAKTMQYAGAEVGRFARRGGIGALCVHPLYRRRGIASMLMDTAETYLRSRGCSVSTLYYPHHILPGIPAEKEGAIAFFARRGYAGFKECVDLWRNLDDFAIPARVHATLERNPNVAFRPARLQDVGDLIEFVSREFPGGWPYSTRLHFDKGGSPGHFIVAVERESIVGFCHTADFTSPWLLPSTYWHPLLGPHYGGLGPVGIAREHRKRGLGLALTAVAVADLKRRGVRNMAIDWTNLKEFYGLLGFTVWKRYLQAELLAN